MKIAIVGTSNSIMGEKGYVKALRREHEIIQLSAGRMPFLGGFNTILKNKKLIEECDFLILDHYVNDINFYASRRGSEYIKYCEIFYQYLSSLNVRIMNTLFPIQNLTERDSVSFYYEVIRISKENRIPILNLNDCNFKNHHYIDQIHLNYDSSYALGVILCSFLKSNAIGEKPYGGSCDTLPFESVVLSDHLYGDRELFENSLLKVAYSNITESVTIHRKHSSSLISIGYLRPKTQDGLSGIEINGKKIGLIDYGYFHEIVNDDFKGDVHLSPIFGEFELDNLMDRKPKSKGVFEYCYLVDLLFFDEEINICYFPASREAISIDISSLLPLVERLSPPTEPKLPLLSNKTIDIIRDTAVYYEKKDNIVAKELMEIAYRARPSGAFIKSKLTEYKKS